ncbi:AIPR family protein [Shewanella livingstonensis]|uniref:Abortive phage infection protein n=1 Tax=Shewanella livingstonensis TaxID=150120 RepID=A0A3G8LYK2_9GAMM|nr:AIPR family protein [Shewanella livingstonensis]AZG74504.1 abortive phage infection protein [Shewanella livingstonensis]
MELIDFLRQTNAEVRELLNERLAIPGEPYPYPESVFTEVIMQHMYDVGMTFEPVVCHFDAKVGNTNVRMSGYAMSDELDQLDLFVSLYSDVDEIVSVTTSEAAKVADYCLRFVSKCAEKKLAKQMDDSSEAFLLAQAIEDNYSTLEQIRVYVLTDRVLNAKSKQFQSREIQDKTIKLEVMDVERLYRHLSEGKPRDELTVNFEEVAGGPLPCVWVPGQMSEYDYAMTVIPGEALRFIYDKYGSRILEANVRSFLSVTGKVNKGIRDTLRNEPERFMAYNNGLVIVADEVHLGRAADGSPGITWLKGMQIVNGGQTSASLYFTQKKYNDVDLSRVRIPAKLIILRASNSQDEEKLIADISRYANSQNAIKQSDFAANDKLHVTLENHAQSTYCPDGVGRWFYERAAGSYKVMIEREGTTSAKQKSLKASMPPARKITKPDMAKYLNIYALKPHIVSLGAQNNFQKFMDSISTYRWPSGKELPTLSDYKSLVAQAILFNTTQKIIRTKYKAFQANITVYTLSIIFLKLGSKINFNSIWENQGISHSFQQLIVNLSEEVHAGLHKSANERMVSEWAKKEECWKIMQEVKYSSSIFMITAPEIKSIKD